jgi:hypothetical protein
MSKFPRLHSFAIDKLASVKKIPDLGDSIDAFHLPLSTQAFEEFHEFKSRTSSDDYHCKT